MQVTRRHAPVLGRRSSGDAGAWRLPYQPAELMPVARLLAALFVPEEERQETRLQITALMDACCEVLSGNFHWKTGIKRHALACRDALPGQIFHWQTGINPQFFTNWLVCAAKGPRPRYPRVWKSRRKIGTISKSLKLVECIKGLSNVKEEVYGALDSFIAWELEFPLITVKKAIKTLEHEKEWKRIIQVTKWMLSKGQGRTMGSYYTLLNALAEDGRLDEAEELWRKLLLENLESIPRIFFEKMISLYYRKEMHEKMFEIFADMEELGVRPTVRIVTIVGDVFQKLDMLDKYRKLKKKYPPPRWEYRYVKGKRIKIRIDASKRHNYEIDASKRHNYGDVVANESDTETYSESDENIEASADRLDTETYSDSDENIEACADRLNENTEACPDKLDEVDLII
nr:pentatricopeptide repeat-containing protein At4g21190 [Ipomoea batatas]